MNLPIHISTPDGYDLAWLTTENPNAKEGLPVVVRNGVAGPLGEFATKENTEELLRDAYRQGIEHGIRALHRLLAGAEMEP